MQKREQNKSGGSAGAASGPAAKRGRPFGSASGSAAASASSGDIAAPSTLLGPTLQVHTSFAGECYYQNPKPNVQFCAWINILLCCYCDFVRLRSKQQEDSFGSAEWIKERVNMGIEHSYNAFFQRKGRYAQRFPR